MSVSLWVERATPKPPSEFCEPASQPTVAAPALCPADRSARIPKAV